MPSRPCFVSFTDAEGIRHTVEVVAESLYEAAVLGLIQFRSSPLTPVMPNSAALTITVKGPIAQHELSVSKLQSWLGASPKSPRDQLLKKRLRHLLEQ